MNSNEIKVIDIDDIDIEQVFLHYTCKDNLTSIFEKGLQPRIGKNARVIEKSRKVFFSQGDIGALVIMDIWLNWLIKKPINNYIYWFGAWLLKIPYFPKFVHKIIIRHNGKNPKKHLWAYRDLKAMLDNSVYLVLALEENVDFSFHDIDEVKTSSFPKDYIKEFYTDDSNIDNHKMEYWNMHTFSNKTIDKNKISVLKINNSFSVNEIIQYMAKKNSDYVKENCKFLSQYLDYMKEEQNEK